MRTIDLQTIIEISRPAAEVFDFVADQTNAPKWQQGLHEVRRTTAGPLGVGTEHVFVRRFAGMRIESRNRFTNYEPGRYVEFEIPSGRIRGNASYMVEPIGNNTSRLSSEVHFRVSGPAGLVAPLLARVFERDSRRDESSLKELLER